MWTASQEGGRERRLTGMAPILGWSYREGEASRNRNTVAV